MRPQKCPHPWTKVTSRHRTSTPGTICVDKCHLRAPCVHARHHLRGQAATFLFRVHKNAPVRGQKSPPGTVRPRQAPSPWTGDCISLPRPQKHPHPWTSATCRHRTSTPGTISVDRRMHFSSASTKTPPSVDKCHSRHPSCHGIPTICDKYHFRHPICHGIPTICDKCHSGHPFSAKYANKKGSCFQKPFL